MSKWRCWAAFLGHPGACVSTSQYKTFTGKAITYTRAFGSDSSHYGHSYLSPLISHVLVSGLKPATRYYYTASMQDGKQSRELSFRTLPLPL